MTITRRALLGGAAAGITFGPAFATPATDGWPARPVRLISPYAAGGSSDISLRILAEYFEAKMGKKFYVENKPGAGSTIANETVARATPDGYAFLYAAAPYETAEAMLGPLSYDPHKDLRPIALAMLVPLFLIVNAKAPYKTLQEFIAYAKSKPEG
ncbi:MAG TPA: tripartite tricarboxylate transporter substrate-binding protein, partial [Bradyrhizobium sp.]|nr:tripartite tricarboxylate transporter substrate-binding protein [Bradyrhizobium sp.]